MSMDVCELCQYHRSTDGGHGSHAMLAMLNQAETRTIQN